MGVGWRGDVRDQAVITVEAFRALNPTVFDRTYRKRPESIAETASVFIGGITEVIRYDAGTWQRVADVEIVCARHLADNAETGDELEDFADGLVDYLSANDRAHAFGAHTVQNPIGSRPVEIEEGPVFIPAIVITCRATIQQGRT